LNKDYFEKSETLLRSFGIQSHVDSRGFLGICEFFIDSGFVAKRFYFITDVSKDEIRGEHAHKKLEQVFVCLQGSFELEVNDGINIQKVVVNNRTEAFYLKPGLWREMSNFTNDAICLVIASDSYDPIDYILDFNEYLGWINGKR
jgi:dTDP-4-dehydrorhamnose 3,5-epimerase-like enzyme